MTVTWSHPWIYCSLTSGKVLSSRGKFSFISFHQRSLPWIKSIRSPSQFVSQDVLIPFLLVSLISRSSLSNRRNTEIYDGKRKWNKILVDDDDEVWWSDSHSEKLVSLEEHQSTWSESRKWIAKRATRESNSQWWARPLQKLVVALCLWSLLTLIAFMLIVLRK